MDPLSAVLMTVSNVCVVAVLPCRCVAPHERDLPGFGKLDQMDSQSYTLVHLCDTKAWSHAQQRGELRPEANTGFIHLSTLGQVHLPANRLYRGRQDLVLLYIDPRELQSPLRWEPGVKTDPASMLFPHLYGRLPVAAVVNVVAYRPGPDGSFPPADEGSAPQSR